MELLFMCSIHIYIISMNSTSWRFCCKWLTFENFISVQGWCSLYVWWQVLSPAQTMDPTEGEWMSPYSSCSPPTYVWDHSGSTKIISVCCCWWVRSVWLAAGFYSGSIWCEYTGSCPGCNCVHWCFLSDPLCVIILGTHRDMTRNLKGREYLGDMSIDVRTVLCDVMGTISWDVTLCSSVEVHILEECWWISAELHSATSQSPQWEHQL